MKRPFAVVAFILTLMWSAFGQEPTYKQTQKWVVAKISTEAGYNIAGDYNSTYEQVSMDECALRFTNVTFKHLVTIPNETTVSVLIIPLNKVISVKLSEHPDAKYGDEVFMDITTTGKAIKETLTVKDEKEKVAPNSL